MRVYELQGDLFFGSLDSLARVVAADLYATMCVLLDYKWIGSVDAAAAVLLGELCRMVLTAGCAVAVRDVEPGSVTGQALVEILVRASGQSGPYRRLATTGPTRSSSR